MVHLLKLILFSFVNYKYNHKLLPTADYFFNVLTKRCSISWHHKTMLLPPLSHAFLLYLVFVFFFSGAFSDLASTDESPLTEAG